MLFPQETFWFDVDVTQTALFFMTEEQSSFFHMTENRQAFTAVFV
jgi:hypothetical protein